jgi:hypothetical protein
MRDNPKEAAQLVEARLDTEAVLGRSRVPLLPVDGNINVEALAVMQALCSVRPDRRSSAR